MFSWFIRNKIQNKTSEERIEAILGYKRWLPDVVNAIKDGDFSASIDLINTHVFYKGEYIGYYVSINSRSVSYERDVPRHIREGANNFLRKEGEKQLKLERETEQAYISRRKAIFGGSNE